MPFQKGRARTGGRQPGTQNKFTSSVKEAFSEAFEKLGGAQALAEWGMKNKTEFYKLASKLIPTDMNVSTIVNPQVNIFPNDRFELPASPEAVDSVH